MRLSKLTSLELRHFLPACHYVAGLSTLQALLVQGPTPAAVRIVGAAAAAGLPLRSLALECSVSPCCVWEGNGFGGGRSGSNGTHPGDDVAPVPVTSQRDVCAVLDCLVARPVGRPVLESLALCGLGFYHTPAALAALTGLRALVLANNQLGMEAVSCLAGLSALTRLDVSRNLLQGVPVGWEALTCLEVRVARTLLDSVACLA